MVLGTGWPASLPWPGSASSHLAPNVAGLRAEGDPERGDKARPRGQCGQPLQRLAVARTQTRGQVYQAG